MLVVTSFSASAQVGVEAAIHRGFLMPHRPNMKHLPTGPAHALEVRIVNRTTGSKYWQQLYKRPEVGITIRGFDLANRDLLGYGLGTAGFFSAPVVLTERFRWNLEIAAGLGLVSKPFDYETNYKNIAIGSYLNAFIFLGQHFSYRVSPQFYVTSSMSFNHFSNAAFSLPNLGVNYPMISVGGSWIPERKDTVPVFHPRLPRIENDWSVAVGFGIRETNKPREEKHPAFSLTADRNWGLNRKSSLGTGIDVFYNSVLIASRLVEEGEEVTPLQNVQLGAHLCYRLHVDRMVMMLAMGAYAVDSYKRDGVLYHRAGFRYYFGTQQHWGLNLCLKTHFFKADFFELGATYRF